VALEALATATVFSITVGWYVASDELFSLSFCAVKTKSNCNFPGFVG
jgi:hypothetical protein